jgi:hypothetical protein
VDETEFFKHVRFTEPLKVVMDGKKKTSAIIFNK